MSHVYTPNSLGGIPFGITLPDDGIDMRQAASVNVPIEAIADGLATLAMPVTTRICCNRYIASSTNVNGAGFTLDAGELGLVATTSTAGFRSNMNLLESKWAITNTAAGPCFLVPLDDVLPHSGTITQVSLAFIMAFRASGSDPTNKCRFAIARAPRNQYSNLLNNPPEALNSSSDFVQYTSTYINQSLPPKTLAYTCNQNNVIDKTTYTYYALVFDESGTNVLAGGRYFDLTISLTYP